MSRRYTFAADRRRAKAVPQMRRTASDGSVDEFAREGRVAECDRRGQQDDQLDAEVEERRTDAREGEDLAGEVDLLDQTGVADDRGGAARDDLAEQPVCRQPGEDVDREVRDTAFRTEELADDDVVDRQLGERADERPHESECAVLVTGLEVSTNEETEHLAMGEDLTDRLDESGRSTRSFSHLLEGDGAERGEAFLGCHSAHFCRGRARQV
jgi:hypothetical protein